jgi:hypothetical protein
MELPPLPYDFQDAQISNVAFGPRQEFTLTLLVMKWDGSVGRLSDEIKLRFGGVKNLPEVAKFFETIKTP